MSSPIHVDFLAPADLPLRGRLGLAAAPGRTRPGFPENGGKTLAADLRALRDGHGASVLVTLMEEMEMARLGLDQLLGAVRRARIESIWFPVPDLGAPTSLEATAGLVEDLLGHLTAGRTVVVHCLGGLGRSGTIAACVLAALGREGGEAVALVRKVRPGAVQTPLQEAFVRRFGESRGAVNGT